MTGMKLHVDGGSLDRTTDVWRDAYHEAAHMIVAAHLEWSVEPGHAAHETPGPVVLTTPRKLRRSRSAQRQVAVERVIILLVGKAASEEMDIDVPTGCQDDVRDARRTMREWDLDINSTEGLYIARIHVRNHRPAIVTHADAVTLAYLKARDARR